ncbi:MFS transporter [Streptomyces sp. NPDC057253]|uniref:MFS transporter n=1 Tax=Streptomyces sp. NPDC057253 TaxID=3346069 RepID=UPI0036276B9F
MDAQAGTAPSGASSGKSASSAASTQSVPDRRRWWVLAVMSLAQLIIALDATVVNVALPEAQRALGFSDASRQWAITAYALTFGSLLLIGGRIADTLGRRRTLLIGLAVFGIGSALGGAAGSFGVLAAARALQGVGGALLAPAALGTVQATFTRANERARAFSVFGTVAGLGAAVGLLLGGLLTEHLNWRWTMYVNLVLSAVAVVGTLLTVRADRPTTRARIDVLGTVLVTGGLFALVFGFSRAEVNGWSGTSTWSSLTASAVLLTAFLLWQARAKAPLMPLRIFADRNRSASLLALLLVNTGVFSAFLFLTYYLQVTLKYSPVETGLAFLPLIGGTLAGSVLALSVFPRFIGPRVSIPAGMLLAAVNLLWLTQLDATSSYTQSILPALVLLGAGVGIIFPTATNLGTSGVQESDHGVAGALVNTTQQVGGSVGIALLSTLSASATGTYLAAHGTSATALQDAALHGYSVAYAVAAGIFAGGALLSALLFRNGIPDEIRSGEAPVVL